MLLYNNIDVPFTVSGDQTLTVGLTVGSVGFVDPREYTTSLPGDLEVKDVIIPIGTLSGLFKRVQQLENLYMKTILDDKLKGIDALTIIVLSYHKE